MEESTVTIKAKHNDEIRRFTLPASNLTWSSIQQHLYQVFSLDEASLLSAKYEDEEKELITITTDEELKLALATLPKSVTPVLKIYLVTKIAPEIVPFGNNNNDNFISKDRKKRIRVEERIGFDEKLKTLTEFGFDDPKLNFRAMKKFYFNETDFPTVIDYVCARSEKKNKTRNKHKKNGDWENQKENKRLTKRKDREERKKEREERKKGREKNKKENYEDIEKLDWNAIQYLYLDGNNMMYISKFLRDLIFKRKKNKNNNAVEEILAEVAKDFGIRKNIKHVTMIFDATKLYRQQTNDNGTEFLLCSARPEFKTSDDRLVVWAKERIDVAKQSLFVTSDRELCNRLKETGALLLGPKTWLKEAAGLTRKNEMEISEKDNNTGTNDLDDWFVRRFTGESKMES